MDHIPEIIPTAEPFFIKRGPIGCLLLHGYTGTPKEMRMLADSLVQDNYTVLAPRLFGHATHPDDMLRARWWDWIASVEDGLNLLRGCTEQQVVMGLSMGGILTMLAAARCPIKAAVTFSAPYNLPRDWRFKFIRLIYPFMPKVQKGKPDWHNQDAKKDHVDYPYMPTRSLIELHELTKVMQKELIHVQIPVLFCQSRQDLSIPQESMDLLYQGVSSKDKTKLWVTNSGHVIIREPQKEEVFSATKEFLNRILQRT